MVWPPSCTRGNKTHGVSVESLIVKMVGSIRKRLAGRHVGDPLAHGEGPRLSMELPDQSLALARDSLQGAPTKTRGKLERFLIPQ